MLSLSRLRIGLLSSSASAVGGGVAFSPISLFSAGEQGAWYDPSDFSTMFQDTAGTVPVTAAGQSVALIRDKSGRGNHATQATAASRPIYQVDGNGKAYLLFDGTDDWLISATITPGIDKAQVFAGVRKLSDAGDQALLETSAGASFNNGAISLFAPVSGGANYNYGSRGTTFRGTTAATFTAPITNVVTGTSDISGDIAAIRVNGVQASPNTNDQGTGNYLAYPLYIGRRGGSTLPFNGRIYQMLVRFGANLSAATITQTENYTAAKTGIYTVEQLIRLNTLNASGVSYNAYAAADSNGNNYPVTNTVLAADGTPYSVL